MPSPFPGMDPYLEEPNLWPDVHLTLTVLLRSALNVTLPSPYRGVLEVLYFPGSGRRWHWHVKVVDREQRIISAVEILSHEIKTLSPEREAYLEMRQQYFNDGVNLVEFDLLRGGSPMLGGPEISSNSYSVVKYTPWNNQGAYWNFGLRSPIPSIPIPLLPNNPEPPLNLRECLDQAYHEGRYAMRVNYREPPVPPLEPSDAEWAKLLTMN